MKKVFSVFLIICIIVACSACGVNSIEEACEKADEMLVKYSKRQVAACTYEGEYTKMNGVYYYYVVATATSRYSTGDPRQTPALMTSAAYDVKDEVYPDLQKLFDEFDVDVIIAVSEYDGTLHSCIINGEIKKLD